MMCMQTLGTSTQAEEESTLMIVRGDISGSICICSNEAALGSSEVHGCKVILSGLVAVPWQIWLVNKHLQVMHGDAVGDLTYSSQLKDEESSTEAACRVRGDNENMSMQGQHTGSVNCLTSVV